MNNAIYSCSVIVCFLLVAMLGGCGGGAADGPQASAGRPGIPELAVTVQPAVRRPLTAAGRFTGNLLPRRRTVVVAEVTGTVVRIPSVGPPIEAVIDGRTYSEQLGILPGQFVAQGDVILELDRTELDLRVAVAEAKLAKARADAAHLRAWERPEAIDRLRATRDEAAARLKQAQADLARQQQLHSRNASTLSELEQSQTSVATAQSLVDSQESLLKTVLAGPTEEEFAVQQALVQQAEAELNEQLDLLSRTTVTAPFDGVVTEFYAAEGMRLTAGSGEVCELLDIRYLIAEVGVPEAYLGSIQMQDRSEVSIAGSQQSVLGLVVAINGKVDPESRTFRIRVAIDNLDRHFKAGQFAAVSLPLGGRTDRLVVPSTAVVLKEGEPNVFIHEQGRVRQRPVTVGLADAEFTEIVDGLVAGEEMVTHDPTLLSDGAAMRSRLTTASVEGNRNQQVSLLVGSPRSDVESK
jgi:HlyD family secretion protein